MGMVPENMRPAYRAGYRYQELINKGMDEGLTRGEEKEKSRLYEKMLDGDARYQELFRQGSAAAAADEVWGDRAEGESRMQYAEADLGSKTPAGNGAGGNGHELA